VVDSNITNPTLEDVYKFAKTNKIEEVRRVVTLELESRQVKHIYDEIEKPIITIVSDMNERGIKVDKIFLEGLSIKYHKELTRLEKIIWQRAGEEFNINSPKILAHILFDKLALAGKRQKKTPT
jgi:DNA polymerase-1